MEGCATNVEVPATSSHCMGNSIAGCIHSIRSLLCTATNLTPHERMFSYTRRSACGQSLPTWLSVPGPVYLKRFVRNKNDPLVDEVELLEANPKYAHIRYPDGRETSVSLRHLAPYAKPPAVDLEMTAQQDLYPAQSEPVNQNVDPQPSTQLHEPGSQPVTVSSNPSIKHPGSLLHEPEPRYSSLQPVPAPTLSKQVSLHQEPVPPDLPDRNPVHIPPALPGGSTRHSQRYKDT